MKWGNNSCSAVWVFLLFVSYHATCIASYTSPWGWECRTEPVDGNPDPTQVDRCIKVEKSISPSATGLNTCILTCGPHGAIWPRPTGPTHIGPYTAYFLPQNIGQVTTTCPGSIRHYLDMTIEVFVDNINKYHPDYVDGSAPWDGPYGPEVTDQSLEIHIIVTEESMTLDYNTDESYDLNVVHDGSITSATITAPTFFGARHGLESLSQLIDYDEEKDSLQVVHSAQISDSPVFPHRGIIVDTARNFMDVKSIERTIDAMAASKLNIFHWHITDSHTFPLNLENLPDMVEWGTYSSRHIYQPADILHLKEYALVRGIYILPEFDAPAHVGNGFQWTEEAGLGKVVVCLNKEPWMQFCVEPPCGQFNLANSNIYTVLSSIYDGMVPLFQPLSSFHYGGDEVNLNCWNTTQEIIDWMTANDYGLSSDSYYEQWSIFQENARLELTEANGDVEVPGIIWTSSLTESGHADQYLDPEKYIIQIWTTGDDPIIGELLEDGFNVIFSNFDAWYLDCGYGAWVGGPGNNWCSPYKGWQTVYENNPIQLASDITGADYSSQILGGEAALWSEQVDSLNADAKLWPRASALAERLWTNPSESWRMAETRMIHQRQRLVARGIAAERLQPEWCHQNEGLCYA
ncbi:unnamed protein product [Meganyctiphanes norvegica]|uniref:Beta-hexosaminidase n=1 Tax=Meganyctiphanes norvegica TaxID=48144 RepID=A0AAV2R7W6_MEGNR